MFLLLYDCQVQTASEHTGSYSVPSMSLIEVALVMIVMVTMQVLGLIVVM